MIEKVTMHTVKCDVCGKEAFEGREVVAWDSADFARDMSGEEGWTNDGEKDYCPDCYRHTGDGELSVYDEEPED